MQSSEYGTQIKRTQMTVIFRAWNITMTGLMTLFYAVAVEIVSFTPLPFDSNHFIDVFLLLPESYCVRCSN